LVSVDSKQRASRQHDDSGLARHFSMPMKSALSVLHLSLYAAVALNSFCQAEPPAKSNSPIAIVAGEPISEQELLQSLGPQLLQLRNQEYELKSKALDGLIRQKLVEVEARKRGVSTQKLLEQEVDSKVPEPTDGEVEAYFWGQNRAGARLDEVKDQFRANLKDVRIQKARQAYADSLRARSEVASMLRPPSVNVSYDRARVNGDPNAPITIVEFSDFQCPFCKKSQDTLRELLAKYDGRIKLAFLDFPLSEIHPQAEKAAEAARCAGEQGKFWNYHDSLFEDQSKLDEASLIGRAQNLKLDESAFQSCLASEKFKAKIDADRQEGTRVGVDGTPGFFVNGVFLSGAQPRAEFEKIIDNALAARGKAHVSTSDVAR
jgi:protein-disulfide isomerase